MRALSDEDALLELADHLPKEAAEALLDLAVGRTPVIPVTLGGADAFAHTDAQWRFRVMADREELERALDYPWEKWTISLHPAQRQIVEKDYARPARVAGSAGTGKTIVALHRAVFVARKNREARVLLTTFSEPLANAFRAKLRVLIHHEPRLGERIEAHSLSAIGRRLYEKWIWRSSCHRRNWSSQISESSRGISCRANGIRSSMPGSWRRGGPIGMWSGLDEKPDCRRNSATSFGR